MIEWDIWLAANEMIKQFGEDAAVISATRADALRDLDDEEGYSIWKRIVAAINELRSTESSAAPH
jgi:hypothetical protein